MHFENKYCITRYIFLFEIFKDDYLFWKWIDLFKCFIDDSINCVRSFV